MSQVRKLLEGNKIPKYKYGHLIIDGIDLGNSEDVYKQFAQHAKLQDSGQGAAYSAWLQQLANGEDVILGVDNSSNVHPEGMTDARAEERSWGRKVVDDIFNTDRNKYSEAIVTARRFTPIIQPKQKTSHNNSASNFVFVGETPKYDKTDKNNLALRERFDTYLNWLSDDLWDEDNQFSTALTDNQKSALKAWYNSLEGSNPYEKRQSAIKQWNDHLAKVEAAENGYNSVDESTRNFFADFNIGNASASNPSTNESDKTATDEGKIRKILKDAGYNEDLYKILGDDIEIDSEGTLRSKSGAFDLGMNGNIYFNDDFYTTPVGASGQYDPLHGLTLYNGALYKNDSARLAQILNASGGFNEAIKNGNFDLADSMIQTRFSDARKENPGMLSEDSYSQFLTPGHRFSNLTGLYGLKDGTLGDGEQIVQYFDLADTFNDGVYLDHNYNYGIFDSHGNKIRDISMDDLQRIQGGQSAGALNTWKRTTVNSGPYKNKFYEDITGNNGEASGIRIYRDINNPDEDVILHIDDSDWKLNAGKGHDIKLPVEVAKILMSDQSWVNKIIKNSQARKQFGETLSSLIESRFYRTSWEGRRKWNNIYNPFAWWEKDVDYKIGKLKSLGLDRKTAKALQKALVNASKGSKQSRRDMYLLETPEFKAGGKFEYISKLASGGLAGGTKSSQGVSERRVDAKVHNPTNASGLGDIGSDNWTDADTKDLVALAGDIGSLGLAFAPGANVASAVTGAAGSLARYSADKDRGTSGAGLQLGINLAMDAATLLPFIGGAAKTGKVVKAVKSALPVIIKAASVYGLGSAVVVSAKKIANGEKFTVRDVSNVVNGITAGVGLAKSGGFGKSTKVKTIEDIKITGKDGKALEISGEDLANVSTKKEFFDLAFNKAKANDSSLTEDAFIKNFGSKLETFIKTKWTPGWKPKDWTKTSKSGKFNPNYKTDKKAVEANGKLLHDWWYGVGNQQKAYIAALQNEAKRASLVHTAGGSKSSRMTWDGKSWVPVSTRQVPVNDGNWAMSSVSTSAGGPNPNNLPAVVQSAVVPTPTRQMQTRITLNPKTTKNTVTRGNGVRFDKDLYNLIGRQAIAVPQMFITQPRTNNKYEQLYGFTASPMYKKGGILKGQDGMITPEEQKFINEQFNNSLISNIEDSNIPNAWKRRYIGQLREQTPIQISGQFGDNNIDTSGALEQLWKKTLGAGEYFVKARGRRNVADIQKRGLLRADYDDPYVLLQDYDTRDPYSEAQIQAINQMNANPNVNPNADYTAYLAGRLGLQAQILPALNNAYRNASQNLAQKSATNTDIHNKQSLMDQEVTSKNRARHAGTEMNLANVDASLEMQDAMSLANAIREERTNTFEQLEKAKQFAYNRAARDLDDRYEKAWNSRLGDKYSEWMNLDQNTKDNYSDINDWLQRAESNKGLWINYENAWNEHQDSLNREREKLYMKYNLSPSAQALYRQRYLKNGGNVRRNRYKNEPEEDVWIDQNRAVHKAVAKLNDNIIRIFLKTLG